MEVIQTINCGTNFSVLDNQLGNLMDTDVSGIRLNFSKYGREDNIKDYDDLIRTVMKYKDRYKFLYDIPYPYNKSRVIDYNVNGNMIVQGEVYKLYFNIEEFYGKENAILLSPIDTAYSEEKVIYFGDGQGAFKLLKVEKNKIIVRAMNDFEIYKRKAITYGKISMLNCIQDYIFLIKNIFSCGDYGCALSLIEEGKEIYDFKNMVNLNIPVIAKIETKKSLENLNDIIIASDGVMAARGDLALLNQCYQLYGILKNIVEKSRYNRKQIFMATDILQSMDCGRYLPSRADIIDLSTIYVWNCDSIILGYNPNIETMKHKIFVAKQIFYECESNRALI